MVPSVSTRAIGGYRRGQLRRQLRAEPHMFDIMANDRSLIRVNKAETGDVAHIGDRLMRTKSGDMRLPVRQLTLDLHADVVKDVGVATIRREHIPVYPVHTTAERLDQLELHIVHVGEREAQVHLPLLAEHFRGKLLFHHQKLRHFVEIPELVKAVVQILCYPGYLHDIAERQARCDRHFVLRSASPTSTRGRAAMVSPLSAPNLTVWR